LRPVKLSKINNCDFLQISQFLSGAAIVNARHVFQKPGYAAAFMEPIFQAMLALFLCLIKHHSIKTYGGVEVHFNTLLRTLLGGRFNSGKKPQILIR